MEWTKWFQQAPKPAQQSIASIELDLVLENFVFGSTQHLEMTGTPEERFWLLVRAEQLGLSSASSQTRVCLSKPPGWVLSPPKPHPQGTKRPRFEE